jgi:hypothetical protein
MLPYGTLRLLRADLGFALIAAWMQLARILLFGYCLDTWRYRQLMVPNGSFMQLVCLQPHYRVPKDLGK